MAARDDAASFPWVPELSRSLENALASVRLEDEVVKITEVSR
jgi:hypothetical protein